MKTPTQIILDTDMGNDIDDAMAMSLLHALQAQGECRLLAVSVSKDHVMAPVLVDILNRFYGCNDIPVGQVKNGVTPEDKTFLCPVCNAKDAKGKWLFPRGISHADQAEDAVVLLRRTLAAAKDRSVVVVMIGFATNFAQLFDSGPDEISPLTGLELVEQKVDFFSVMAGDFSPQVRNHPSPETREYNVRMDIAASQSFYSRCPRPMLLNGFEIGNTICYPVESILSDYNWCEAHPMAMGYRLFKPMPHDRPCWDPATLLYAVRPHEGYFGFSDFGTVSPSAQGDLFFTEDPTGMHRFLTVDDAQRKRIMDVFLQYCPYNPQNCLVPSR